MKKKKKRAELCICLRNRCLILSIKEMPLTKGTQSRKKCEIANSHWDSCYYCVTAAELQCLSLPRRAGLACQPGFAHGMSFTVYIKDFPIPFVWFPLFFLLSLSLSLFTSFMLDRTESIFFFLAYSTMLVSLFLLHPSFGKQRSLIILHFCVGCGREVQ